MQPRKKSQNLQVSILTLIVDRRVQKMKTSRNTETREEQTREYTYEEPNLLDIPDEVYDRFLSQGLALRWIRISLKGDDDYKNVGRKTQQGYEFVDPKEVPEMLPTSLVIDKGRYENCVVRGDVALAKIAKGQAEARNKYYQEKSDGMMDAVNQQLMSNNDSRMPIQNSSKSKTTVGRQPKFSS